MFNMEATMRTFRILLLSLIVAAPILADDAKPPALEPGLGQFHWAVSAKNAEAQKYFDQGMKYLYGFNHESAVRSFQHATQLDPDLAMGYWGAALALGPNINLDVDPDREKQAYDGVQAALAHASHASAKERDLIDTLAKRYSNDPKADLKKLSADYSASMGALTKKYPSDLDIATLYAESMMDLHPWKFWSTRRQAERGHDRDRLHSRIRSPPQPQPPRRESLLHSRRRSVGASRARARQRPAAADDGSRVGPSRPHARAHLSAHRQLHRRRAREHESSGYRSRIHQEERRRQHLRDDVLQPQSSIRPGVVCDGRTFRRGEENGR
jgi:hypothetical protein